MSAYNRGELSVEAYLVRIIAALCRQNNGELRVRGDLIDTVGEATVLLKAWDNKKQELVLTTVMGTFGEVFRVVPEKQSPHPQTLTAPTGQTVDPLAKMFHEPPPAKPINTATDDEKLAAMERVLKKRQIARMLREEMQANKRESNG